jgi:hypothetical protein
MAIFKNYILVREAAQKTGYHPDHISALVRSGKVDGKKVGRNWVVSEDALRKHHVTKRYVSAPHAFSARTKILGLLILAIAFIILVATLGFSRQDTAGEIRVIKSISDTVDARSTDSESSVQQ